MGMGIGPRVCNFLIGATKNGNFVQERRQLLICGAFALESNKCVVE